MKSIPYFINHFVPDISQRVQYLDGEGNGNPLQYSCLENPMDSGAWWATVHGVARVRHDLVTNPPPPVLRRLSLNTE